MILKNITYCFCVRGWVHDLRRSRPPDAVVCRQPSAPSPHVGVWLRREAHFVLFGGGGRRRCGRGVGRKRRVPRAFRPRKIAQSFTEGCHGGLTIFFRLRKKECEYITKSYIFFYEYKSILIEKYNVTKCSDIFFYFNSPTESSATRRRKAAV